MEKDIKDKKITIIGLGKSGYAAAELACRLGAHVKAIDACDNELLRQKRASLQKIGVDVELGLDTHDLIKTQDLIIASPGVGDSNPAIRIAKENNIEIIDEVEFAFWYCKSPIVAVTGTNGKSTTVSLLAHITACAKKRTVLLGNIGNPFSRQVLDLDKDTIVILEVSSFQLSRIDKFRPHIAIFLNATQNHLDRHKNFNEYIEAKFNIFHNQTSRDFAILNFDDPILQNPKVKINSNILYFTRKTHNKTAFIDKKELFIQAQGECKSLCRIEDVKIKGPHNLGNALAASLAASLLGIEKEYIKKGLSSFEGLEHRNEFILELEGVRFINDSKSTTPDATRKALESCSSRVVLIAGGRDKQVDFSTIRNIVKEKVKTLLLIGEARKKIKASLGDLVQVYESSSLEEAVSKAHELAKAPDEVLLSPMCASFDMFEDFKDRGRVFKKAVESLKLKVKCAEHG